VLVDKVTDLSSFAEKLEALKTAELVSETEKEMLEVLTEAGNAAAHRGYAPEEKDLIVVMDILESVIKKLYVTDKREQELLARAQKLKGEVPPRKS